MTTKNMFVTSKTFLLSKTPSRVICISRYREIYWIKECIIGVLNPMIENNSVLTGKSFSEALILASTNPQYVH